MTIELLPFSAFALESCGAGVHAPGESHTLTLQLDLSLDFSISRVYDVKNSLRLLLYHSESTVVGASCVIIATCQSAPRRHAMPELLEPLASLNVLQMSPVLER